MEVRLGIKSDPVQNRFSYEWLFSLMNSLGVHDLQLGGFIELPMLEDGFFYELREKAEKKGINIKSLFSMYRVMGGFFNNDSYMEKAARLTYEKYISAGALLGVDYVGASAGPVYLDKIDKKNSGIQCFFSHMEELMALAKEKGLKGLSTEIMSSTIEFPTSAEEIDLFMGYLGEYHKKNMGSTVPFYLLGDISHGYADKNKDVVFSNYDQFEYAIPYICEFHFKNTDRIYNNTFGFSEEERGRGFVDLAKIKEIIFRNEGRWPVDSLTGYLEHPGPKLGRDYTDHLLKDMLIESIQAIQEYF